MKSFIKSWLLVSGLSLLLAITFAGVFSLIGIGSDLVLLLFPGLWVFFSGITVQAILLFVGITAVSYLVPGLFFTAIYKGLQRRLSRGKAFLITICIPIVILIGIGFLQYQEYKTFYHLGATPEECAALDPDEQGWCYSTLYRKYSIPEVCLQPGLLGSENGEGEAEECARRYGAQSGKIEACSVFKGNLLYDDCRWGVAFITKDKSLCKQLSANDGNQKSCINVIDNWKNNVNFYLYGK